MSKNTPLTERWSVERHDHDDGVISYEIWGYLRGEYSFLFHIYEQPFVDEAERLANVVVRSVNCHDDMLDALKRMYAAWNRKAPMPREDADELEIIARAAISKAGA